MKSPDQYDSIIIGGGPAGSTAAALLAEKGRNVLVLEKETFPRYHVGESLMPFCYHTLERLGVIDQMDSRAFTKKYSVQFVTEDAKKSRPFYFFQHYDHPSSTTWQVNRDEFDEMLLNRAAENGATVKTGHRVKRLLEDGAKVIGVVAEDAEGKETTYEAPITVDASGRDAMVLSKRRWRVRDEKLNKIALWTYYRGGVRDSGLDAGSTTVAYLPEKGWFWFIPMKNDIISLGVVAERDYLYRNGRDPAEIMTGEIENNLWIKEHLAGAEQFGRYWVTGEYSYRGRYCAGDGVVLIGDAFAFLDPVFSSGVFLALKSGELAADAIDEALRVGNYDASQFDAFGEQLCKGIEIMRKIVYAFYDKNFSFGKLIKKYPDIRGDLTDCLIGNLYNNDFQELFSGMMEFAELPAELEHGRKGESTADQSAVPA